MRRLTLALAGVDGMLAASPSLALAAAPPLTGASAQKTSSSLSPVTPRAAGLGGPS